MKWRNLAYLGSLGYIGVLGVWNANLAPFALIAVLNVFWLSKK